MANSSNSPAFQFYPKDWLSSAKISQMPPEAEGAYIRLLCFDWDNDGIPDDDIALAQMSRLGQQAFNACSISLRACFVSHPDKVGFLTNKRLQNERVKQQTRRDQQSLAGKNSAKARTGQRTDYIYSNETSTSVQRALNETSTSVQRKVNSSSSSSSSSSKDCTFDKSKVLANFQIPDFEQAVKNLPCSRPGKTKINQTPTPPEERSPLLPGHEHFRASPEQITQAKKSWSAAGNKPDDFEAAIREVDLWLQGETAGALKARKSKAHTRHIHAAWVLENLAQRKKSHSSEQRKLSAKEKSDAQMDELRRIAAEMDAEDERKAAAMEVSNEKL